MKQKINSTILAFLLVYSCSVCSAEAGKIYKIGVSQWTGYPENIKGFKKAMSNAGLLEGQNIEYLMANSGTDTEKLTTIAQSFNQSHVDLVYTLTTPGTIIIKQVITETIPIVFSIVTYPADSGLIESFEYSANNLVGTSNFVPLSHYISLVKKILPNAKRLAIFHKKGEPNSKIQASNLIRLFRKVGIETFDQEPETLDQLRKMALSLVDKVDVFMTTTDTLIQGGGEKILIEISKTKNIPIISSNKKGIESGSTFGPVADFYTLGHMSGEMAAKILIEQLTPASLSSQLQNPPLTLINRSRLEQLGLVAPDDMDNIVYVP